MSATRAATAPSRPAGQRRDIQGLRALAVALVVIYHLWPQRMTGGFVGVDVFFVISGYLITGNLLRKPIQGPRDLLGFWGRRIRRLLPAATVVLVLTLIASVAFLPSTTWRQVAKEVIASAAYVENWALAASATNYLAADQMHTPVQHYWSLSVEEQFYIVWPVLLMFAYYLLRKVRSRLPCIEIAIGLVFASSLIVSVVATQNDPASAYFITPTRMWELAAGGVGAVISSRIAVKGSVLTAVASWLGIGMCVVAGLCFDAETPFPGIAALLPVAGSFLVLVANADGVKGSPDRLWRLRVVQLAGDASYSLYLWHWPFIVILPFAIGHDLRWPEKIAVILVVFGVAVASKFFIEDPVRRNRMLSSSLAKTFAVGAACMGLSIAAALCVWVPAVAQESATPALDEAQLAEPGSCIGADVMRNQDCRQESTRLLTSPQFASTDKSDLYKDGCWENRPFPSKDRPVCHYGAPNATKRIALVGNSHAGHWQPAIVAAAKENGWKVDTYLASECYVADVDIEFDGKGETQACRDWVNWVTKSVAGGRYDLVIASSRTGRAIVDVAADQQASAARAGYASVLDTWTSAGIPVLVLRDNPYPAKNGPDCVAEHEDDLSACHTSRSVALHVDPLTAAAQEDSSGLVQVADLTNLFCTADTCPTVVGNVIVYSDASHITKTYATTLTPDVAAAIQKALS